MTKFLFATLFAMFFLLQSCSTVRTLKPVNSSCFVVLKIKKLKNNVYFIYAQRNDTVFKIATHFVKNKKGEYLKLKKGSVFKAHLYSQFVDIDKKLNMMPNYGISILFHGVTVSREPQRNINDVFLCNEINGRYIHKGD